MDFYNLISAKNNYKVIVDTDIQIIVKNLKNGEMLRFHRVPSNLKKALDENPNLPILQNGSGVFVLRIEIKPSEIMIESKKLKNGRFYIGAKHGLITNPLFEEEVEAKDVYEALDMARVKRDMIKGPFLADTYGKSTNNDETRKGRSEFGNKRKKYLGIS